MPARTWAAWGASVALVLGGCGGGAPPLDDNPIPDPDARSVGSTLCLAMYYPLGASDAETTERTRQLDEVSALGVRTVRVPLRWDRLEPTEGERQWARFDMGVADTAERGIELLANLGYGVPWASSATDSDPFFPPDDPADFAAYAAAVTERYRSTIKRWEIWNEQNAGYRFWKPAFGGDPYAYGRLLTMSRDAIHAVDPDAEVLYGGTFFHSQFIPGTVEFMTDHFAGVDKPGESFDGVAFHPYGNYPPQFAPEISEWDEIPMDAMVSSVKQLLSDFGIGQRTLYATEFGWPSFGEVSREQQAAYLARAVLWLARSNTARACWFALDDGPRTGQGPPEDDFGLIDWNLDLGIPGQRKPSWFAMRTLANVFDDVAFVRDESSHYHLGDRGWAFRFANNAGKQILAVWVMSENDATEIHVGGTDWNAVNATGNEVSLVAEDNGVTVWVSEMPTYLTRNPN